MVGKCRTTIGRTTRTHECQNKDDQDIKIMGGAWGADVCPQDIKLFVRGYNNGNNNSITINEKKDYDNREYHHGNS